MDHKKSVFSSRVILQVLGNENLSSPWNSLLSGSHMTLSLPLGLCSSATSSEKLSPTILALRLCSLTLNSRYLFFFFFKAVM